MEFLHSGKVQSFVCTVIESVSSNNCIVAIITVAPNNHVGGHIIYIIVITFHFNFLSQCASPVVCTETMCKSRCICIRIDRTDICLVMSRGGRSSRIIQCLYISYSSRIGGYIASRIFGGNNKCIGGASRKTGNDDISVVGRKIFVHSICDNMVTLYCYIISSSYR